MEKIYLDNAATTKVDERVVKAMLPYFSESYGNASSTHYIGEEARRAVEEARGVIAKSIYGKYKEIVFTSGGTESNNLVLKSLFFYNKKNKTGKNKIVTTAIEHDCVLNACKWIGEQGGEVVYIGVDKEGFVDLKSLEKAVDDKTFLVSVIHGNNEMGTVQNLEEIGRICKSRGVLFHTDACQSFTKIPIHVKKMNLDFVTLNAHKIHGPKGVSSLYVREGLLETLKMNPLFHGGGHEFGVRSGTENVPGIVGFAKAVSLASSSDVNKIRELRDYFILELLKIEGVKLNGSPNVLEKNGFLSKVDRRLCNNVNVSISGVEGEMLGSYLNARGIFISTGSACASHTREKSHVLKALGLKDKEIEESVRISLSKFNTKEEIDFALAEIKKTIGKLR